MKKFEDLKIKLNLSIGFVVGNRQDEVFLSDYTDEDEWKSMNIFEQEQFIHEEIAKPWSENYICLEFEVE